MTAKTTPTRRYWHIDAVGAAICAALTVLGFLLVVQPALQARMDQTSLRSEVEELQRQILELDGAKQLLGEELSRLEKQLAADRLKLQRTDYLNTRMALIIESASNSGIVIDKTRSGAAREAPLFQTVPIFLSGTGTYPGCAVFLRELHERLPDTGVVSFELTGDPGRPGAPARFRFSLVWYAAPALAAGIR